MFILVGQKSKWGAAQNRVAACLIVASFAAIPVSAQTTATLTGRVLDPQGAAVSGAGITLSNAITGFERTSTSAADATFTLTNIPLQAYTLKVEFPGFRSDIRQIDLRTNVPVRLDISLAVAQQTDTVVVSASDSNALVDTTLTGTRTSVSLTAIERMPTVTGSRGLESVLVSFPGFAQNANGAIHPRGAHNQMTFVVDGLPISDQLTGAFANALDAGIVQTVELMTGNVPAEFGSKVSGVAVITSRSGLGIDRPVAGDVMLSAAGVNTWNASAQFGGDRGRLGYFGSATAMRTDRFLDQVSRDNLHNAGRFGRAFGRVDFQATDRDMLRFNAMGGRSHFEVANLRSQHAAGQDQEQTLSDAAGWLSYLQTLDPTATFESTVGYRATSATLDPSKGDTPVTAWQRRRLFTLTAAGRYTKVFGAHSVRAGVDVHRFPVEEAFTMGITSPSFNDPDSDRFNRSLLPHDLTRGGTVFEFSDARAGRLFSGFVQSSLRWRAATLTLGVRHDHYSFLVTGQQLQPRVGVAYQLPGSAGVIRASYNRNYQTPPNENLLLSSSREAS